MKSIITLFNVQLLHNAIVFSPLESMTLSTIFSGTRLWLPSQHTGSHQLTAWHRNHQQPENQSKYHTAVLKLLILMNINGEQTAIG